MAREAKKKTEKPRSAEKDQSADGKDPFRTRKRKTERAREAEEATQPPPEVAEAIDGYVAALEQVKHFEGEATVHKDRIMSWAMEEFARRLMRDKKGSFRLQGDESQVTFVVTDSSAGLTEEDVEDLAERFGKDAAERLVVRDLRTIRFDPDVLEEHYDEVVAALSTLPEPVLSRLFKPMLMRARPGAALAAREYADSVERLAELLVALRIRCHLR